MSDREALPLPSRETAVSAALAAVIITRLIVSASINPGAGYLQNAALAALLILIIMQPGLVPLPRALVAGLGLYAGAAIISIPGSILPPASLRFALLHLGDLLLFLAVFQARASKNFIAAAMTGAAMITAAFALRQHFGGFARTLASPLVSDYAREMLTAGRVFGLTFSPDMLAAVMAGTMPIALDEIKTSLAKRSDARARLTLALHLPAVPIMLGALCLTTSLGGMLAAAAGTALWAMAAFAITPGRIGKKRFAALAAAGAAVCLAAAYATMLARGGHFLGDYKQYDPLRERLDNWKTGIKVFGEAPLTGVGAGQYGLAMTLHRSARGNEAKHVHNTPIEVLAETGPAGLAGWVIIMAAFAAAGWKLMLDPKRAAGAGFFAGGAAVALHALIDFDWAVPEVAAVFWVSAAMVFRGEGKRGEAGIGPGLKAALIGALAVTIGAELYQGEAARRSWAADAAAREGRWAEAKTLAESALAWDRGNDASWAIIARAMAVAEPRADRTFALRRAISINPRSPYYHRDLGEALRLRNPEAAGQAFARAAALYPNSLELNLALGRWLLENGRYGEAEPVLLHAAECHWSNADPLLELGRIYLTTERDEKARKAFLEAASSMHLAADKARAVARWLEQQGRRDLAGDFLSAWLASHPDAKDRERIEAELKRMKAGG